MCNYFNMSYALITCHRVNWCTRKTCCVYLMTLPSNCPTLRTCISDLNLGPQWMWSHPSPFCQLLEAIAIGSASVLQSGYPTVPSLTVLDTSLSPTVLAPCLLISPLPFSLKPSSILLLCFWHFSSLLKQFWTLVPLP